MPSLDLSRPKSYLGKKLPWGFHDFGLGAGLLLEDEILPEVFQVKAKKYSIKVIVEFVSYNAKETRSFMQKIIEKEFRKQDLQISSLELEPPLDHETLRYV